MSDKRRWTTPEQRVFLESYVARYLEAQAKRKYSTFWPVFFQAWFAKYPEPEPLESDPTETDVEDDSEPDAESNSDSGHPNDSTTSKRKRSGRKARALALKKKVSSSF
jgi:hypothetical protein